MDEANPNTIPTDRADAAHAGVRAAVVSIIALAVLASLKGFIGWRLGSVALIADGFHSFSDIFVSATVIFGLKFLTRSPTARFPYGYARVETFAALIAAGFIFVSAIGIGYDAMLAFIHPSVLSQPVLAMAVAGGSAGVLVGIAQYKARVGARIGSEALKADAKHSLSDVLSSLIVIGGIAGVSIGYPQLEAVAGLVIAGFIIKIGIEVGRDAVLVLLDAWDEPGLTNRITTIITNHPGVIGVVAIKLRKSGPFIFGEVHLELEPAVTIGQSDRLIQDIKTALCDEIPSLEAFTVETGAKSRTHDRIGMGVESEDGLAARTSAHFGECPFFLIVEIGQEKITNVAVVKNPGADLDRRRGAAAAEILLGADVNIVLATNIGPGGYYLLKEKLVEVRKLPAELVGRPARDVVSRIHELEPMNELDTQTTQIEETTV